MNVLLTGISGFLGRNIKLSKRFNVIGIVRRQTDIPNAILIENPEKKDAEFYKKLFEENDISAVIHAGAITGEKLKSWREYYTTNVLWTKNLALGFKKANIDHRLFIFISSVGVYGTIPRILPANEKAPLYPDGKYHKSKVLAENTLRNMDIPLLILRPTIMYGFYDYGFMVKLFKLVKMRIFPIWKNPTIHLLDVSKVAEVCELAIRNEIKGVFNICDDTPIKLLDLVVFVKNTIGGGYIQIPICMLSKLPIIGIKSKLICYDWFYDTSKAKKVFGSFGNTFENLERYISWYSSQV